MVAVYNDFRDIEGFAKVATINEILAYQANLNIPLYVRSNGNNNKTSISNEQALLSVVAEWQNSSQALRASMDKLFGMLKETGIGN